MRVVCVRLDSETAERLRELADNYFGGNVSDALRHAAELLLPAARAAQTTAQRRRGRGDRHGDAPRQSVKRPHADGANPPLHSS
ncbi:hypothetical protein [Pyrobaculum sp.]|uniref:hypothetical protein n=1 Tax=Pyrobaculum sp. TaxID=2004705 RepID=UPI003D104713